MGKLRNENAILRQKLGDLERSQSQNPELENENRRLAHLQQTTMMDLESLQGEVQQFRNASNVYVTFVDRQIRSMIEENEELEARAGGKPRVPRIGGWLGVNITNTGGGGGIVVKSVLHNSPAAKADIQEGDIIEAIDGALVQDPEAFKAAMAQKTGGRVMMLDINRDNSSLRIEVTPIDWPQ